jgi:NhaA family Na+:H+ antiporter
MSIMRSERSAATFLLVAAALGLLLANTAAGPLLLDAKATHLDLPALGLSLSLGHWVSDGLLAIFFFIVAIELKHELTAGSLNSVGKAFVPAIAAIGGILVPAGIYLVIAGSAGFAQGWPVPTATDIAFALGVLAVFGKGLPGRIRIFLLALAVLDDLVAILIIALFFTSTIDMLSLGLAAIAVLAFAVLSRMYRRPSWWLVGALIVVGVIAWYFVYRSGVHATIAGVALGLVMAKRPAERAAHALEPVSNGLVLPLFAFSAALVAIPAVGISELSPVFWGILVALPVGKLVGITAAGWLGQKLAELRTGNQAQRTGHSSAESPQSRVRLPDLVAIAMLGGIGFTVSLLMNELAFIQDHEVVDEGTLAVLLGSTVSIVVAAVLVNVRSRAYRRAARTSSNTVQPPPTAESGALSEP